MFLFSSDSSVLRAVPEFAFIRKFAGEVNEIRENRAGLVWTNDGFTVVKRTADEVVVESRRPDVDREAICALHWNISTGSVRFRRRWSGEFGAYVRHEDRPGRLETLTILTSHLKLVPALTDRGPQGFRRIDPGSELRIRGRSLRTSIASRWSAPFRMQYAELVRRARQLIIDSVSSLPAGAILLLSGGIDSSALAAAARVAGVKLPAITFTADRLIRPELPIESDVLNARKVARHLGIALTEVRIPNPAVVRLLPLGIYLGETARGTIVDDCAALVYVARYIREAGFSRVLMGEAADDLFGGFKFALRLYRGSQLRAYYRSQLTRDLPNELAIIQNVFAAFGISVIQPMWTSDLLRIGYNLPLAYRVDEKRLMKQVLRDAFMTELPEEIVHRPKCVTRDSTQIRYVLEQVFGTGRDRYREIFRTIMNGEAKWPKELRQQMRNCSS